MIVIKFKHGGAANLRYDLGENSIEMFVETNRRHVEPGVADLDPTMARQLANALVRLADYAEEAQEVVKRQERLIQMLTDAGVEDVAKYIAETPLTDGTNIRMPKAQTNEQIDKNIDQFIKGMGYEEDPRADTKRVKRGPDDLDKTSEE